MLSVTNKPFMLSVFILIVATLKVVAPKNDFKKIVIKSFECQLGNVGIIFNQFINTNIICVSVGTFLLIFLAFSKKRSHRQINFVRHWKFFMDHLIINITNIFVAKAEQL